MNYSDENFVISDGVLESYVGEGGRESGGERAAAVRVPDGVTEVGGFAFARCAGVAEIFLPDSVKIIGEDAFMGCSGLVKIRLPSGLERMGRAAFRECDSLEEMFFPEGIRELPSACFYQCLSLRKVTLSETLTRIAPRAFSDCISLERVELPSGLRSIEEYAFEYCSKMESIALPDNLENIDRYAFASCHSLERLVIPPSVKKIGEGAFYQTKFAESGGGDFLSANGILFQNRCAEPKIKLPRGTKVVGDYVFESCETLEEIVIPEGVREIGSCAFKGCERLERAVLPESLEVIGGGAFADCPRLSQIDLPENLRVIGSHAFERTALVNKAAAERRVLVANGKYLLYSPQPQGFSLEIPQGAELIAGGVFTYLGGSVFKTARLDGVKSVGGKAFERCSRLEEVFLPDVRYIGGGAFMNCENLHAYIGCRGEKIIAESQAFEKGQTVTFIFGRENFYGGENGARREFTAVLQSDLEERGGGQSLFNFAADPSESNFAALSEREYKLAAAVCFYGCGGAFGEYLRRNIADAVKLAVDRADSALLRRTLDSGYLGAEGAAECVDYAIAEQKTEQQVILMRYRQENFGDQIKSEIDSRFDW